MLTNMGQIPTNQACNAVTGKTFTTTMGGSMKMTNPTAPIGMCYKTLDNLFHHLAAYPIVSTLTFGDGSNTTALRDLFADGKCVSGDKLAAGLATNSSFLMNFASMYDDTMGVLNAMAGATPMPTPAADSGNSSSNSSYYSSSSLTMVQTVQVLMKAVAPSASYVCLHMPTDVSCDYGTDKMQYAYKMSRGSRHQHQRQHQHQHQRQHRAPQA